MLALRKEVRTGIAKSIGVGCESTLLCSSEGTVEDAQAYWWIIGGGYPPNSRGGCSNLYTSR